MSGRPIVVICGSMRHHGLMTNIAAQLAQHGVHAIAPTPDTGPGHLIEVKRRAGRQHMDRIQHADTTAVLAVNPYRLQDGCYLGPNTLGELAVAFAHHKPIWLLHDVPVPYTPELHAWGARCLHGDLQPLLDDLRCPNTAT